MVGGCKGFSCRNLGNANGTVKLDLGFNKAVAFRKSPVQRGSNQALRNFMKQISDP